MDIGKKIRELRTANDLTLEELASRSELTKGFLSQVERNLTSPSISTLEDNFFEDDQEDFKIEWIVPNAQKNDMEPILLTLHPGAKSMEMVSHSGEEFGYVLKGTIMLVIGSQSYRVKAKETFYIDGTKSHYLMNPGSADARILWITTPPMF